MFTFTPSPPVVRPPCAALLDQGRHVGGDPVGHACYGHAEVTVWAGGMAWRVCRPCAALVREGSPRVTLPRWRAFAGDDGAAGG